VGIARRADWVGAGVRALTDNEEAVRLSTPPRSPTHPDAELVLSLRAGLAG
jgi:hypothetical protein